MTTENTITIEPHEVEGVRDYAEFLLGCDGVFPSDPAEWDRAHKRIGWLLDVRGALGGCPPPVRIHASPFLEDFAREGGEHGRGEIGDALAGRLLEDADLEAIVRRGKGLISFADRLGVYEGVVV